MTFETDKLRLPDRLIQLQHNQIYETLCSQLTRMAIMSGQLRMVKIVGIRVISMEENVIGVEKMVIAARATSTVKMGTARKKWK